MKGLVSHSSGVGGSRTGEVQLVTSFDDFGHCSIQHCWSGIRKDIQPVKNLLWLSTKALPGFVLTPSNSRNKGQCMCTLQHIVPWCKSANMCLLERGKFSGRLGCSDYHIVVIKKKHR